MIAAMAMAVIALAGGLVGYTYFGYPLLLRAVGRRVGPEHSPQLPGEAADWPPISVLVAAYNEERQIRRLLESLLALDYPPERCQILIVSDASTDGTDEIVREYADRGVELLRLSSRGGKTAAENAAADHLRGDIVVNTDASIRIRPDALRPMIAAFRDLGVGVVSGRDVSVAPEGETDANVGEGGYVDYEMRVRELETQAGGIVGASGCFFATRSQLQRIAAPLHLSRDFAAALTAYEHGYRAISMGRAVCLVPRARDLRAEYRRKVRTFTRGMATLRFKRHLANPLRHPLFAWKLLSHKVCRWLVPWAALAGYAALALLAPGHAGAALLFAAATSVILLGVAGWLLAPRRTLPRWLALPSFALAGSVAVLEAALRALRGERAAVWEPTRRDAAAAEPAAAHRTAVAGS